MSAIPIVKATYVDRVSFELILLYGGSVQDPLRGPLKEFSEILLCSSGPRIVHIPVSTFDYDRNKRVYCFELGEFHLKYHVETQTLTASLQCAVEHGGEEYVWRW